MADNKFKDPIQKGYKKDDYDILKNNITDANKDEWRFKKPHEHQKYSKTFALENNIYKTRMANEFCKYSPDIIYQYINITHDGADNTLSVSSLPFRIFEDLKLAFDLLEQSL